MGFPCSLKATGHPSFNPLRQHETVVSSMILFSSFATRFTQHVNKWRILDFLLSLSLFHLPLLFPLCHLNAAVKRGWMQRGQALYPRPDKSVEDAKIYMDSVKCKHAGMLGFFATRKQGSRARLFR